VKMGLKSRQFGCENFAGSGQQSLLMRGWTEGASGRGDNRLWKGRQAQEKKKSRLRKGDMGTPNRSGRAASRVVKFWKARSSEKVNSFPAPVRAIDGGFVKGLG